MCRVAQCTNFELERNILNIDKLFSVLRNVCVRVYFVLLFIIPRVTALE